ncbi:universal stress protein [Salinadaptatus halalkaliphilus]|uniref:Universal stress protein n=1 Tax=Salinadaptatus halalkaliphilus TaxID=2419781 RepID=A0A4S3TSV6_9EURY|nr:universal stress protein [Salinadaptatus halalkaliphilus]THE66503.1 universal stress protein [Salinadaptatus halalkaliphilus]
MTRDVPEPPSAVLVGVDGSDAARAALERGLAIAARTDATVHLLAVVDSSAAPLRFDVATVAELERAKRNLLETARDVADGEGVEVTGAVRRGRPAREIVRYATAHDVDLIVVGRTGLRGVAAPLLGSTADRVLRRASVPVIVVPPPTDD